MNRLQDQGRACYKRGEYEKAIEHFDRAIGHNPSVQLLDNRAACYEKLGELNNALKDAKRAVQEHREDPTGYLRAGKVLMKMEKQTVALEVYGHGLRCIKHVGKGYELLRKVHKELLDQISPPKSVDPMTVLPRELALYVLEYLSFKQLMNACLVSKQWTEFIRSCPDLWRCLDLSQSRKKVRNVFVSRAINTGKNRLTSAVLANLYDIDKTLRALIKHSPLQDLSLPDTAPWQLNDLSHMLNHGTRLKKLCIASKEEFHGGDFTRLLGRLPPQLEWFDCNSAGVPEAFRTYLPKGLHTLHLSTISAGLADHLLKEMRLSSDLPLIRSLKLHSADRHPYLLDTSLDLSQCSHLQYLDLKLPLRSASQLRLPQSLTVLKLHATTNPLPANFWFIAGNAGLEPYTFFLPNLEELDLEIPRMVVHNALHAVGDKHPQARQHVDTLLPIGTDSKQATISDAEPVTMSKLHTLAVRNATLNYKHVYEVLKFSRLSELQHLSLPQLASCSDEDAIQMIDTAPHLLSLDLSEVNITGITVKRALKSGRLRKLVVNNCTKISPDAIELARAHGVKVQHRMSNGANGGRKVRQ